MPSYEKLHTTAYPNVRRTQLIKAKAVKGTDLGASIRKSMREAAREQRNKDERNSRSIFRIKHPRKFVKEAK